MIFSPFTPLFFDRRCGDGLPSRYVQTFAQTDVLLVECICAADEEPELTLRKIGSDWEQDISLLTWTINGSTKLMFTELKRLDCDTFILGTKDRTIESHPFRVTNNQAEIDKTVLLQYSMEDDTTRTDAVFKIAGQRRFFDFRVPGGFKDTDWSFDVDSEQYTTPQGDLCTLYALDTVRKKLTIGGADGVPIHFGELLNRLLTCTYIYIDGVRYSRYASSVPESTVVLEGIDSFVIKVDLQKVNFLNPTIELANLLSIRRDFNTENYRVNTIEERDYNIITD